MMDRSLMMELIDRTRSTFEFIKRFTLLSRERLDDKRYRDVYCRMITKDIDEHVLLLEKFLRYIEATTPTSRTDTVNTVAEEIAKSYEGRLSERKITLSREFDQDLPETVVPDEQLKFIFDALLQCSLGLTTDHGQVRLITRSCLTEKESREELAFWRGGKSIEILIMLSGSRDDTEKLEKEWTLILPRKKMIWDLLLRMVEATVRMNRGLVRIERKDGKRIDSISVRLPVERRNVVSYQKARERIKANA